MRDGRALVAAAAARPYGAGERVFPGRADQLAEVRAYVAGCLTAAGIPDLVDDAVLCVDELFSNAVRHTQSSRPGGEVTVLVDARAEGGVVCHVHDQGGPTVPAPRSPDSRREGGRGLRIVAALASEVGYGPACGCSRTAAGGCCAWFRLDRGVAR